LLYLTSELILVAPLPRMLNSVVPRSNFDQLARCFGSLFAATAPDFRFCFRLLASEQGIIYLDEALTIMHALGRSNGSSTSRGVASNDTEDFLRLATSDRGLNVDTEFPAVITTYNIVVQEYVSCANASSAVIFPPLNRRAYLRTIARETDQFAPGTMKLVNTLELSRSGVRFSRWAKLGRSIGHYWHLVRVLGIGNFQRHARQRLIQSRSATKFSDVTSALDWAATQTVKRQRSTAYLRYLTSREPRLRLPHRSSSTGRTKRRHSTRWLW